MTWLHFYQILSLLIKYSLQIPNYNINYNINLKYVFIDNPRNVKIWIYRSPLRLHLEWILIIHWWENFCIWSSSRKRWLNCRHGNFESLELISTYNIIFLLLKKLLIPYSYYSCQHTIVKLYFPRQIRSNQNREIRT